LQPEPEFLSTAGCIAGLGWISGTGEPAVRSLGGRGKERQDLEAPVIVLIIFILGIVFGSIALANFLNSRFEHAYTGYLLAGGAYILLAVLLIIWVIRSKVPLLTSLFVKILVNLFNIRSDEDQ
jgi:hypothetical protein